MAETLHQLVRQAEENYTSGTDHLGKYVDFSMYETIEKIFAYLNSKLTSGPQDSLGRDKPFFNIVTAAVNIWYRATDIDRKDIIVLPDKQSNIAASLIATILLQEWMKKSRFGVFLNTWGRTLAQYGSAVVKFVEKEGELVCRVVPWNVLIVDPIDFKALPVIEKFYKTPAQLRNMANPSHPDYAGYDSEAVEKLIESRQSREGLDGQQKDNRNEFVELYEVHGELSKATYLKAKGEEPEEGDDNIFFQQMHVLAWSGNDGKGDFTLFSGKEKQNPYMITHLIEEEGRTLAIGAVEYLFDAQWMINHTMKAWKDQMDLASKLIFQTTDQNLAGRNILTNMETGDIVFNSPNTTVGQFPNIGHDITSLEKYASQWRILGQEVTSTPDAARGVTPPSGTALGTVQITTAQGLSLFELMTENKGGYVEEMLRVYIIPHLKKKLNNQEEIAAVLEEREITKIDKLYVPREAVRRYNDRVKAEVLNGQMNTTPYDPMSEEMAVKTELSDLGNTRFLSPGKITWREVVDDLEWKLDVNITNEQIDKQAAYQTILTMLDIIAKNPAVLTDPNAKLLFNKTLAISNLVSPAELSPAPSPLPNPQLQALAANNNG